MPLQDMASIRYSAALESLKENNELILCLQLNNCQIDDERVSKLFLAMEYSDTITSVDLSNNFITDDGAQFLVNRLKGGSIPSLIFLDMRGNPITSRAHDLLAEIQHVRKILKIYHDFSASNTGGHFPELDEEVGTERAVNLYRSKWSSACTDNGDNWLLSKSRICDQSAVTLKDRVHSIIEFLKNERRTIDSSKLAVELKEISLLASQELSLPCQKGVSSPVQVEYSEAILLRPSTEFFWSLVRDACLPSFLAREGTKCAAVLQQGRRPSYCGHIFALSKTLNDLGGSDADIMDFLNKSKEWTSYVAPDGSFRKMQAEQSGDLCGPRPVLSRLVTNFLQNPARNLVQVNQFTV